MSQQMEQVKHYAGIAWKHRFWICVGVALLMTVGTYTLGSKRLFAEAERKKNDLDKVYADVKKFTAGMYPNQKYTDFALQQDTELVKVVDSVWQKLYERQKPLMTWPASVQELYAPRPFGADLSDNRGKFLVQYRNDFSMQKLDLYDSVDPIRPSDTDGSIVGTVEVRPGAFESAAFGANYTPVSMEAWLAQEELWIHRAIAKAIVKVNKEAIEIAKKIEASKRATAKKDEVEETENESKARWKDAWIRSILLVRIADMDLRTRTTMAASNTPLIDAMAPDPNQPAPAPTVTKSLGGARSSATGPVNLKSARYLTKTEQFRVVPVSISLLVDQAHIPNVLAGLAAADFNFTIRQVSVGVPDAEVRPPQSASEAVRVGKGVDKVAFNTLQMDVWGQVRLYELPPSEKKKWEEEKAKAEKKATGKEAKEEAKPASGDAPAGDPKAEAKAEPKAEAKAEPKADAKDEAKEGKEAKPEAKPADAPKKEEAKEAKPAGDTKEAKPVEKEPKSADGKEAKVDAGKEAKPAETKISETKEAKPESKEATEKTKEPSTPKAEEKPAAPAAKTG